MLHHHRRFAVTVVPTMGDLTEQLTQHTWTLCACFEYQGLLLANDSFSEDSAQEYAVYKEARQIESLTVSWMTRERLQEVIEALRRGGVHRIRTGGRHSIRSVPGSIAV